MRKITFFRKISQLFFLSFFVYILWSTTYPLKGFLSPKILFEMDPLIMMVTALSERILFVGLFFALAMILLTFIFGRFFCGWVCPMGTVIDMAGKLGPRKKRSKDRDSLNRKLRLPKMIVVYGIILLALLGIQSAWVFDPIVMMARVISLSVIPAITLVINKIFIYAIQHFGLYGSFYDFYRDLKNSVLGINVHFFDNSLITFLFFVGVCLVSVRLSRAWCRILCPLGAFYSLIAKHSLLKRFVFECSDCGICRRNCRMGAIKEDNTYVQGECILCMDCVVSCKSGITRFAFRNNLEEKNIASEKGITRRGFLYLLMASVPVAGAGSLILKKLKIQPAVLRPPGALERDQFVDRCVRCGNCMKVCITNGLQPVFLQEGLEGLWTPQLVPEIGYCEYNCTLCGDVCPTGAIPALSLEQKKHAKIGTAKINHSLCLPWAQEENCLVCEEHCPVADKAIKTEEVMINGTKILRPHVDENICIGCGICQNKCPIRPQRAIRVI